jgi:hypothetical protein
MQPRSVGRMKTGEVTLSQARQLLDDWRVKADAVNAERAGCVQVAALSGLEKTEISRLMGIARSTVYADLAGLAATDA